MTRNLSISAPSTVQHNLAIAGLIAALVQATEGFWIHYLPQDAQGSVDVAIQAAPIIIQTFGAGIPPQSGTAS